MGNSGSTVQEPEPQAQPVEDQFEVSISTNLVYRLAAEADKEAARQIPVQPILKEEKVEPQLDHTIVDQPPPQQQEPVLQITPINTEKLSELLESQRQERRAEADLRRAQQLKVEEDLVKEVEDKIYSLRNTYARGTTGIGCEREEKAVVDSLRGGNTLKCRKAVEDLTLCAKARLET